MDIKQIADNLTDSLINAGKIDEDQQDIIRQHLEWACVAGYEQGIQRTVLSKPIKQVDLISGKIVAIHNGIREAARKVNGGSGAITKCVKGKKATYKGYKWFYYDEYKGEKVS